MTGGFSGQGLVGSLAQGTAQLVGSLAPGMLAPNFRDPVEALHDLRLPPDLTVFLEPALATLGCRLELVDAFDDITFRPRSYTSIKHDGRERVLLHMPDWTLSDGKPTKCQAFHGVANAFLGRTTNLFICSKDVNDVDESFGYIMETAWPKRMGITGKFVPWRSFLALQEMSPEEQKLRLRMMTLKLDELLAPDPGQGAGRLPHPMPGVQFRAAPGRVRSAHSLTREG